MRFWIIIVAVLAASPAAPAEDIVRATSCYWDEDSETLVCPEPPGRSPGGTVAEMPEADGFSSDGVFIMDRQRLYELVEEYFGDELGGSAADLPDLDGFSDDDVMILDRQQFLELLEEQQIRALPDLETEGRI